MVLDVEYSWAVSFLSRLAASGAVKLVDDDYLMSRFWVSDTDAERSGLDAFEARRSVHDVSVSIRSIISFSPVWDLFRRLGKMRLTALSSPRRVQPISGL